MNCIICQTVTIVDMNNEILSEVLFHHGKYEGQMLTVGCSVVHWQLGLSQFEVVYDKREGKQVRHKIVDIEFDLLAEPAVTRVYLEPVTLIIGQHDIGMAL